MLTASLFGFLFGFVGSVPVAGPIAILVFSRGLQDRARGARYLAAGAAIAESAYAYLAFWGFSELLLAYPWIVPMTRGAAAILLTALGAHFAFKRDEPEQTQRSPNDDNVGLKRNFVLGLTITVLNPTLIATWTAAVTFLHSLETVEFGAGRALPFSAGVAAGIWGWFVLLLMLLRRFRDRFTRTTIDRIVRGMGLLLIGLGLFFGARFVLAVLSVA